MTAVDIRRRRSQAGFTIIELLIAVLIMMVVTGAIFSLMNPAQGTYQIQPEVSDLQQRLRVGIDSLQKDLVMAGAGTYNGVAAGALTFYIAPIMPYKAFGLKTDTDDGVFFRPDTVSLIYVPPTPSQTTVKQEMPPKSVEMILNEQPNCPDKKGYELCGFSQGDQAIIFDDQGNWDMFTITQVQDEAVHMQHRQQQFTVKYEAGSPLTQAVSVTYYLLSDDNTGTYQLRYYDGWNLDLPIADNVVDLRFRYFGEAMPPQLTGRPLSTPPGPWTTYGPAPPQLGSKPSKGSNWPEGENCTFQVVGGVHVSRLATLGAGGLGQVELTPEMLTDGPWCPDAIKANRFDADLLRVRRVRATVRVQAALATMRGPAGALFMKGGTAKIGTRFIPDQEVSFDVAPRNLNLGR